MAMLGNWQAERVQKELRLQELLELKEAGLSKTTLYEQRKAELLAPVPLKSHVPGKVSYGDVVLLKNQASKLEGVVSCNGTVVEQQEDSYFCVSLTSCLEPSARSCFVIESADGSRTEGTPLRYGDDIRLLLASSERILGARHYLFSQPTSLTSYTSSRKQEVLMTPVMSHGTIFKVYDNSDWEERFFETKEVLSAKPFLMLHRQTNKPLAGFEHEVGTDFSMDNEVCCHSFLPKGKVLVLHREAMGHATPDTLFKTYDQQNIWSFINS